MGASQLVEGIAVFIQYAGGVLRFVLFGCRIKIARVVSCFVLRGAPPAARGTPLPIQNQCGYPVMFSRVLSLIHREAVAVIVIESTALLSPLF